MSSARGTSVLTDPIAQTTGGTADFLAGGGELGALMRAHDWTRTPLGEPASWPQSLRSATGIMLSSRYPIALYWGEDLALLYNDDWSPIPGRKHPWALGRPAREVWPEIWNTIGPLFERVFRTGEGTWSEDQLLPMYRHGYTEECYFNFTFSPVRGADGRVDGIFNAVVETTFRVVEDRRTRVLRELAERMAGARSANQACQRAAGALNDASADIPFCLIYLLDEDRTQARLAASTGLPPESPARAAVVKLADPQAPWPLGPSLNSGRLELVDGLTKRFGVDLPGGVWPEPATAAFVVPIAGLDVERPAGFLVCGVSPRRAPDEAYRAFAQRAAAQIATVITTARAYAAERRRAEALAELDRAKTAFFSNVSHEFRTPLTLMLGTIEESLSAADIPAARRAELTIAHRNSLRLLRLVNTLLDFSRVEAGRIEASYEPVDLAALTAELASNFRSACERAGLDFAVDCEPLPEPAYVDREMWEKIVLNLVSNAFKFTLQGGIKVRLAARDGKAVLAVSDTGTGIPKEEQAKVFQRFHRVAGARGRTHEGTGIGLALVQELAWLHGGRASVESEVGRGSTFTVSIPLGTAHLPAERIGSPRRLVSTSLRAQAFVDEAMRWLPGSDDASDRPIVGHDAGVEGATRPGSGPGRKRVLVVDDNADMRDYVSRLLRPSHDVEVARDGAEALDAIKARTPDLVLSDVMMPRLDGFGLLRAVRADAALADIPVILLSARAGEEAQVEGLDAGADDYLVKPFAARELLARVNANLQMAEIRRKALDEVRSREVQLQERAALLDAIMATVPAAIWVAHDSEASRITGSRYAAQMLRLAPGDNHSKSAPSVERPMTFRAMQGGRELPPEALPVQRACRGETVQLEELDLVFADGSVIHELINAAPVRDEAGRITGAVGAGIDITQRRRAEQALRESEELLRFTLEAGNLGSWDLDLTTGRLSASKGCSVNFGRDPAAPFTYEDLLNAIHPDDRERMQTAVAASLANGSDYEIEYQVICPNRDIRWVAIRGRPTYAPDGTPVRMAGTSQDITGIKQAERQRELLINELNHRVKNTLATVQSVAMQTLRNSPTLAGFQDAFVSRLVALSRAHDLLTRSNWQSASLEEIVRQTLEPYGLGPERIRFSGPYVRLGPSAAVTLSMGLHELATNAVKYGALSDANGRIEVAWSVDRMGASPWLTIDWRERGGPEVAPPARRGFGSRLIERGIAQELDGDVALEFDPAGVQCRIRLPLSERVSAS